MISSIVTEKLNHGDNLLLSFDREGLIDFNSILSL